VIYCTLNRPGLSIIKHCYNLFVKALACKMYYYILASPLSFYSQGCWKYNWLAYEV